MILMAFIVSVVNVAETNHGNGVGLEINPPLTRLDWSYWWLLGGSVVIHWREIFLIFPGLGIQECIPQGIYAWSVSTTPVIKVFKQKTISNKFQN